MTDIYNNQAHIMDQWLAQRRKLYERHKRALELGHTKVATNLMRDIHHVEDALQKLNDAHFAKD